MGKLRNFGTLAQEAFMSTVIQEPGPQSPLQGLDPNLSFIASQAAIELDNLILGTSKKLDAVHELALRLKNSAEEISGSTTMRNLMDPQSIRVFSQAYTETQGESVSTIDELANKACASLAILMRPRQPLSDRPSRGYDHSAWLCLGSPRLNEWR